MIVAVAVVGLLGVAGGVGVTLVAVDRGPQGEDGPPGPRGKRGPPGADAQDVAIDPELVYEAIEQDPQRVSDAVLDSLDPYALQSQMDPDPANVLRDLQDLCSQLSLTEALADEFISCP